MPIGSPKTQISGGKAACVSQRVADNAFHLSTSGDKSRCLFAAGFNGWDFSEIGREVVGGKSLHIHFDQAHKRTTKIWFACAASIYNHADRGNDAAVRVHDIDCLLHATSARDDVFDHKESLLRQNLKTAAQNEFAFIFLYKNVALA